MALSLTTRLALRDSAVTMPQLGLGTWRSKPGEVAAAVEVALRAGYVHIDAAELYGNQDEVGQGIQAAIGDGVLSREDLHVTSKIWNHRHRPEQVRASCEQTLQQLSLDYLDQLLIHWPVAFPAGDEPFPKDADEKFIVDDGVTLAETWAALEALVDEGLVKSIGVSNFNQEEVQGILDVARIPPAVNQVEAHPYFQQTELREFLHGQQMQLVAYCPLGNMSPGEEHNVTPLEDPVITGIAERLSTEENPVTPANVIIRWHLQVGHVVIPKSVTPSRVESNAQNYSFELSDEDMAAIAALDRGASGRLVNPPFRAGEPVFP